MAMAVGSPYVHAECLARDHPDRACEFRGGEGAGGREGGTVTGLSEALSS